ncbi:MAG TPA: DUF4876 domain-containing protein [Ignavibacteriaceae bacterium]|nr:DUF4876 domain-containing protein [Ignavibacteriaceae bacterium]
MKQISKFLFITLLAFAIFSCREEPPVGIDGQGRISVLALGDTSLVDSIPHFIPMANAKVILVSEYGTHVKITDGNGYFDLSGVPASTYSISIRMPHPLNPNILLVGTVREIEINDIPYSDTIYAEQISNTGIAINEIYAGGPLNNLYFFYDQYIELYNYSDSVKYLDGFIITRVSGNSDGLGPGADEGNTGSIDGVTYIFKFPGSPGEKNYPFYPNTFLVLAQTAVDHRKTIASSIDLSSADWEFYNQYSSTDFDNPNVSNLINIRSDRTVDFLINLVADVIVLADGRDSVWEDGIQIETIVDGIQYKSGHTTKKTLDSRVDKSYCLSPPKYSGQSMQRREPGVDTNDGLLDWEILPKSTPGYQ